jgi:hypothetical protein
VTIFKISTPFSKSLKFFFRKLFTLRPLHLIFDFNRHRLWKHTISICYMAAIRKRKNEKKVISNSSATIKEWEPAKKNTQIPFENKFEEIFQPFFFFFASNSNVFIYFFSTLRACPTTNQFANVTREKWKVMEVEKWK